MCLLALFFHQVVKSISTLFEFELALRTFFDQEKVVKLMLCDFWIQISRVIIDSAGTILDHAETL